jgi:hypothetical protein
MTLLMRLGDWALWGAAFSGVAFVVMYHLTARWWKSEEGWHLMTFTAFVAAVFIFVLAAKNSVLPPLAVAWTRVVIYGGMCALLVWRVRLVAKAQERVRERARAEFRARLSALPPDWFHKEKN